VNNKHYIAASSPDAWVPARPEPSGLGVDVMLPEYLAVEIASSTGGRDVFTVLEGLHAAKAFSLAVGRLRTGNPGWQGPARLSFNIGKQRLNFPGGQVRAKTPALHPIAPGTHPVHIPDFPHDVGGGNMSNSRSWFYLGRGAPPSTGNAGYLNTLRPSEGGITVEAADWPALYQYLILCRNSDGKSVGSVAVVRV
jgi:hypothetical protein